MSRFYIHRSSTKKKSLFTSDTFLAADAAHLLHVKHFRVTLCTVKTFGLQILTKTCQKGLLSLLHELNLINAIESLRMTASTPALLSLGFSTFVFCKLYDFNFRKRILICSSPFHLWNYVMTIFKRKIVFIFDISYVAQNDTVVHIFLSMVQHK